MERRFERIGIADAKENLEFIRRYRYSFHSDSTDTEQADREESQQAGGGKGADRALKGLLELPGNLLPGK